MKKYVCGLLVYGIIVSGEVFAVTSYSSVFLLQKEQEKEIPNPEKAARKLTDEMDELLQLTEKQYKKIYKLNLKEEKEKIERMTGKTFFEGGRPFMPPMDGMPPQGSFPPMNGMRPPMPESMQEDVENQIEKRNKKLKKILTDEQYDKWMSRESMMEEPSKSLPSISVK